MSILKASGSIAGAADTAIITPASGNKWILTFVLFTVDVPAIITAYDETNDSDNQVVYGKFSPGFATGFPRAAGSGALPGAIKAAAADNKLYVNVPADVTLYYTVHWYER